MVSTCLDIQSNVSLRDSSSPGAQETGKLWSLKTDGLNTGKLQSEMNLWGQQGWSLKTGGLKDRFDYNSSERKEHGQ